MYCPFFQYHRPIYFLTFKLFVSNKKSNFEKKLKAGFEFERFVASKILGYKRYKNSISSPIIKISILSIIVGIVVMNISMSTGFGIQKNINEKFSNNVGDLIITNGW